VRFLTFPTLITSHSWQLTLYFHHLLFDRDLTTAQYNEFYKYIAGAYDTPMFTLHFRADAPIDLKCLLYVPSFHTEKFGMGRIEPGEGRNSNASIIISSVVLCIYLTSRRKTTHRCQPLFTKDLN
jgi:Hsp90 protein